MQIRRIKQEELDEIIEFKEQLIEFMNDQDSIDFFFRKRFDDFIHKLGMLQFTTEILIENFIDTNNHLLESKPELVKCELNFKSMNNSGIREWSTDKEKFFFYEIKEIDKDHFQLFFNYNTKIILTPDEPDFCFGSLELAISYASKHWINFCKKNIVNL